MDFNNTEYYPLSNQIFVSIPNSLTDPTLRYIASATLDTINKGYAIDLRDHVQQVVLGKRLNYNLVLSSQFFTLSAERIHFFGPNSTAEKPKLLIKYSSF